MFRPWPGWFTWTLCGAALLPLPAIACLIWINRAAPDLWWYTDPAGVVGVVAAAVVGALVATTRPAHPMGWLLLAISVLQQCTALLTQWGVYALVTDPSAPGGRHALWLGFLIGFLPSFLVPSVLLLIFPSGRISGRSTWVVAGMLAVAFVLMVLGVAVTSSLPPGFGALYEQTSNPWRVFGPIGPLENPGLSVMFFSFCAVCACGLLLARFRAARGPERQQYKVVVVAMTFVVAVVVSDVLARVSGTGLYVITSPLQTLAIGLVPVAMGIAILRYRLWDIDVLINRALVYAALTACVVGIYVLVIGWLSNVFRAQGGGGVDLAFSLVATGIVAVLFQPLRERIQRAVNRLLYGERDEPYAVIARLGRRLEDMPAPDAVLPTIASAVQEALNIPYSAVALLQGATLVPAAAVGTPVGDLVRIPLVYQHEPLGELLLAPRAPGESFSAADRRLLDDLARQAGVAVYAVRLTNDLQQARERLVSAREEERRRLRRDLHDGLGSQLAALHLQTGVLRPLIERDPAAAQVEVAELRTQLRVAIASIRSLVHGLRPPAIDELGLLVALRERVRQYDSEHLLLRAEFPDTLPALSAATEVAVYRIAEEALANVGTHAAARTSVVRLEVIGDMLTLSIEDDGVGIAADARAGVGRLSMRERAEELGGRCRFESPAEGGTRVVVDLPL